MNNNSTTITRYIVHSENNLDGEIQSVWPVRSVPLRLRKLISVDKELLDGLFMLQNDAMMRNGTLFPLRRNKHASGDLSCFSALLQSKGVITRSTSLRARNVETDAHFLNLPMYTYIHDDDIEKIARSRRSDS